MHDISIIAWLLLCICTKSVTFEESDTKKVYLDISNRDITFIRNIEMLQNLQTLNLGYNQLTEIPPGIEQLCDLRKLDLGNNKLRTMPIEVGYLPRLATLNLKNNDIVDIGDGITTMGKAELEQRFGSYVKLDGYTIEIEEVSKKLVYKDLNGKAICWNFDELKKLKSFDPVLKHKGFKKIINRWAKVFKHDSPEDFLMKMWCVIKRFIHVNYDISCFIHHIYNPREKYEGWKMIDSRCTDPDNHPSILQIKSLITSIFVMLVEKKTNGENVESYVNHICEILEFNADRQITEMMLVCKQLADGISLKDFVKLVIGREKERVFGYLVAPPRSGQDVHALNVQIKKMAEEIGLTKFVIKSEKSGKTVKVKTKKDGYNGCPGYILRAFYSAFTPKHVFKVVKEYINAHAVMRDEALKQICELYSQNELAKYIAEDGGITEEFVEWYLVDKGIAKRN